MKQRNISYILGSLLVAVMLFIVIFWPKNTPIVESNLQLTDQEQAWLDRHPVITLGLDPEYAPFEFLEDGEYQGMSLDYLRWIENKLNFEIQIISYDSFSKLLEGIYNQEVDMSGALIRTEERLPHMLFTDTFYSNYDIILMRTDDKPIGEDELSQVKTAVIKDYSIVKYLRKKYPGIELVEVDNITQGLKMLSFGEVDTFVTDFSQATYYIYKFGYQNIYAVKEAKISYDSDLRFGIRKDYPELVSIINKAMASMPKNVRMGINNEWLGLESKSVISSTTFYILLFFSLIVLIVLIVIGMLNRLLKQRTVELEQVIEDLHETRDQVIQSEKMAFLGRLVAGVAHEINTPLGVVVTSGSYLDILTKDLLKEKEGDEPLSEAALSEYLESVKEVSDSINRNVHRVSELVQSFKQLAIDQGKDAKHHFGLKENCDMVIGTIQYDCLAKKIDIENKIPPDFYIESYPIGFSMIFNQLILNAMQHGFSKQEKPLIKIWIQIHSEDTWALYIEDNGKGMKQEVLGSAFDPFYTTSRHRGNSGLGLHIVYNIVTQQLGGRVSIAKSDSEGTLIEILMSS